jgi:transcriptional regulator with XRE-family HTH domain
MRAIEVLVLFAVYAQLLNNLMDGIIYAQCMSTPLEPMPTRLKPSFLAFDCLDLSSHEATLKDGLGMGKRIELAPEQVPTGFGERLSELRKAAGFTQTELAGELGISQRMVAYYEQPDVTPPAHLLPGIAQMLGVSIDTLYGRDAPKRKLVKQEGDSRLRRRLLAVEKLGVAEKRQVLQLIDAFIERGQLRSKVQRQA